MGDMQAATQKVRPNEDVSLTCLELQTELGFGWHRSHQLGQFAAEN